jgi:hypothetical protein
LHWQKLAKKLAVEVVSCRAVCRGENMVESESKDSPESESALPAQAVAPEATTDIGKLRVALDATKAARKRLLAYYENDKLILEKAPARLNNKQSESTLVAKFALSMLKNKEFVISAAGSSVTAGHDGFGTVAWPAVLEKQLQPVWSALQNKKFLVRNMAVGGRDPNPYSLCLAPMLGEDADIIIREWEYWPFSAGFPDESMVKKPSADMDEASLEVFLRTALSLQKQPAVEFLKMGHDGGGIAWVNEWFKAAGKADDDQAKGGGGPFAAYGKFPIFGFDAFTGPFKHLLAAAPKSRKNKDGTGTCDGNNVADCPVMLDKQGERPPSLCGSPRHAVCEITHPPQILLRAPLSPSLSSLLWKPFYSLLFAHSTPVSCTLDGYHTRANYSGFDSTEHSQWWKFAKPNGFERLFVNWHPAPLGHEVGSEKAPSATCNN